jgi:hypothetical protein
VSAPDISPDRRVARKIADRFFGVNTSRDHDALEIDIWGALLDARGQQLDEDFKAARRIMFEDRAVSA